MPNGGHLADLQPSLHSVKDIPWIVRARTVIGGECVLKHVTKSGLGRIGGLLPLPSLYGCSVNPRQRDQDQVKVEGLSFTGRSSRLRG